MLDSLYDMTLKLFLIHIFCLKMLCVRLKASFHIVPENL